jgi:uracil-DNA glycosylase family 4
VAAAADLSLIAYGDQVAGCERCALAETRTQVVFGSGSPSAELMFVGEAPGFHEDKQGVPFVGAAGKLLGQLLSGIGLTRDDVYVCNVLKCRPPGNRDPQPEEIDECTPWLMRQVELIEPRVICTLGNFATKLLTRSNRGIMSCHGQPQVHELGGHWVRLFPLCHPAAALRTPATLTLLREDISRLPALLEEPTPAPLGRRPPVARGPESPVAVAPPQMDLFG